MVDVLLLDYFFLKMIQILLTKLLVLDNKILNLRRLLFGLFMLLLKLLLNDYALKRVALLELHSLSLFDVIMRPREAVFEVRD